MSASVPYEEIEKLLVQIVKIPAPSNGELDRARFICAYLNAFGAPASIDAACNVLLPMKAENCNEGFCVMMAHTDTIFPDNRITVRKEGDILHAPGVGDDTANVAILMKVIETIFKDELKPKANVLFAFDSGEEGLGNLKGVREILRAYEGRVKELVSFDLTSERIYVKAVGSKRYIVKIQTPGGHSFGAFGNENAIAQAAKIICGLYATDVNKYGSNDFVATTYNIGTIQGGTSVNAIAEMCEFTAEVRSDSDAALCAAEADLCALFDKYRTDNVKITYELIGDRPSMGEVDPDKMNDLIERASRSVSKFTKTAPVRASGSTDCNIPLSLNIPAVAFGGYVGGCAHSSNEWIDVKSLGEGYRILYDFIRRYFI